MPFWAKDAAVSQGEGPKYDGTNENREYCGCRVMTHSNVLPTDDKVFPITDSVDALIS